MALSSGTEIYSIQKNGCVVYETTNFPTVLNPVKTYYGNENGANEPPTDKLFYSGEKIGITLGEIKSYAGKLYYRIETTTKNRVTSGLFNLGSGVYNDYKVQAWVLSSDITDSKSEADDLLNNRLNADKIAKAKSDQALVDALGDSGSGSDSGSGGGINVTKILAIALGFVALIVFAVFSFKKNKSNDGLAGNKKRKNGKHLTLFKKWLTY